MKKIFLVLIALLSVQNVVFSQVSLKSQQDQKKGSWYKQSPDSRSYGIGLDKAKELLKNKTIKKTPVVAIIGSGIDAEHEALKHAIWINPKEQANGVDDDRNGYVDDFNGWNFIANNDGDEMTNTVNNADKEWLRLKDKYADYIYNGKEYYTYRNNKKVILPPPSNMLEYNYFLNLLRSRHSMLGPLYAGYVFSNDTKVYVESWDKMLDKAYPGRNRLGYTFDEIQKTIIYEGAPNDSIRDIHFTLVYIYMGFLKGKANENAYWKYAYENFTGKQTIASKTKFDNLVKDEDLEQRKRIVGDNPADLNSIHYGTNNLMTSNSHPNTAIAGIIAGENKKNNFAGIFPEAKIMTLVTNAVKGDPFAKDLVLAIRYAVDNGADVVLMPQQEIYYSPTEKEWIFDAIKYAEKKGVLVVVPVWNNGMNMDMDLYKYYPSKDMNPKSRLSNLITVACTDSLGNPMHLTNYGMKEVDFFAPGQYIYSSIPGDIYLFGNSKSLGAAVTAGSVALIKAYFPKMKPADLRKLLISNVTNVADKEVSLTIVRDGKEQQEQFIHSQLSASGGILNLEKAVKHLLKK